MTMHPIALAANQPMDRFYTGGAQIAAFRGTPLTGDHVPEDWVASVTAVLGDDPVGMSTLPGGGWLADAIRQDPVGWLGADHVAVFGGDPGLLVKLLDAGERLPVHAHPSKPFAHRHLGAAHGKTEAWVFLEPAEVHLGFTRDVAEDELLRWVVEQDVTSLLDAMHRVSFARGDAVLVPAGMPHAIGRGAFVVELQEPTDFSIMMEWTGYDYDGPADGHLGLGFETVLGAIDRTGRPGAEIAALRQSTEESLGSLLPDAAPFFRAERVRGDSCWPAQYSVLVVVAGRGVIRSREAELPVHRGQTIVVPHGAGECQVESGGHIELVRCLPPALDAAGTAQAPSA